MTGHKGTITMHGSRKIALECEEGDAAYAESVCATEELKFYKDNVDPADMTSLKQRRNCLTGLNLGSILRVPQRVPSVHLACQKASMQRCPGSHK